MTAVTSKPRAPRGSLLPAGYRGRDRQHRGSLGEQPDGARRIEAGSFSTAPGTFEGWPLAELAIPHCCSRRTA